MDHLKPIIISDLPLRTVRTDEPGWVRFEYLGFPYIGHLKGNADFHNTRFTPKTDLGDLTIPRSFYMDHGLSPVPELRYKPLGYARAGEETPEGRLVDVYVNERNQYLKLLMELQEMDMLRGSAQALASMYATSRTGDITRFHWGEFSGTVTPSNDENKVLSVEVIRSILNKSVYPGVNMKKEEMKATDPMDEKEEMRSVDEEAKMEELDKEAPKVKRTAEIIAEVEAETQRAIETVTQTASEDVLRTVSEQLNTLLVRMETIESTLRAVQEDQAQAHEYMVRKLALSVVAQAKAMPADEAEARRTLDQMRNTVATTSRSGLRSPMEGR